MSTSSLLGGCLCGKVRYRVDGEPYGVAHCHCEDCRRSSGAPFLTWASCRVREFHVTQGELSPVHFATRFRSHCAVCGTQITFSDGPESEEIDFTVSSLDEPQRLTPTFHIWTEDRLPWVSLADDLPKYPRDRPA